MPARRLLLSVAFVLSALVLTTHASRAEECSASIDSFAPAGHGISGKESIYLVTLNDDPDVTNAEFVVHFATSGPNVTFNVPVTHDKTSNLIGWSWLRLSPPADDATLSLASVAKFGESQPCITPSSQATHATANDGEEAIYDDSRLHADLSYVGSGSHTPDSSSGKMPPIYPLQAKMENIMGTVAVEIEVGPRGGAPLRAWVRWADTTGESDLLSQPSLNAANASKFVAPTIDGRPTTREYSILYTFSMGDAAPRFPDDEFGGCPLELVNARVAPPSGTDPNAWYFLNARAKSGDITSALIAVEDEYGRVARYPWNQLSLRSPSIDETFSTASALFNSPDPNMSAAWVVQVTNSRGATIVCDRNVDEPGRIASAVGSTRVISGKPLDILGLEPMERARFAHEVMPVYPQSADGTRAAGHVTIDSIVDATGHVIDSFITRSSGLDYLDASAMKAALASTYEPAASGAVRAYELTYRFVP
jgi:TonB family protein